MEKILLKELQRVNRQLEELCKYYRHEFGERLHSGKLVLKTVRCNDSKQCPYCPHGPYWYRATFNSVTRKFVFKYVGATLKKASLKKHELKNWERYKFYNEEIKRLKQEKKRIILQLKAIQKEKSFCRR